MRRSNKTRILIGLLWCVGILSIGLCITAVIKVNFEQEKRDTIETYKALCSGFCQLQGQSAIKLKMIPIDEQINKSMVAECYCDKGGTFLPKINENEIIGTAGDEI